MNGMWHHQRLIYLALLLVAFPLLWPEAEPADKTAVPHLSHPAGLYDYPIAVKLDAPPSADILYTLNGRSPTPDTAHTYQQPIPLDPTTPTVVTLRARLRWPDGTLGPETAVSYFLGLPNSIPLLNLALDPAAFNLLYDNYGERGRDWEKTAVVSYHDPQAQTGFTAPAGLRIHGRISRAEAKKSFRLYFRSEYGLTQLDYPLFNCSQPNNCPTSFKRLVIHNGGQDSPTLPAVLAGVNWTLLRNQLAEQLAQEIGTLTTSHSRPTLLFVNGQPWGIYLLRERIDDIFLAERLGIETADMLDTPERLFGDDQVTLGDRQHWDHLLDYVASHDLHDPAAYEYVQSQINIDSFIDYHLFQIFVANDDWPMHNVRLFRPRTPGGRWHWIIWDIDRGFAFTPPSSIDKNMFPRAEEVAHELTTNRHTLLYRRLLENDAFRAQYLARLAALLDTTFAPQSITQQLDKLVVQIEPVIDYEIGRWQPSRMAWGSNIADLYDFAQRRSEIVRQQAIDHFGVAETAVLQTPANQ